MAFVYHSGEKIESGDRVILHGEPGEIEFVADPSDNPTDWYVQELGGGVMIVEPKVFGHLFLPPPVSDYDGLEFVSRG